MKADAPEEEAGASGLARRPVIVRHIRDLIALDPAERFRRLAKLTLGECGMLLHDWRCWAREDQLPPAGEWVTWLILAGRGAGKTRTGAETVKRWIKTYPIVNLIGPTAADVRDVMVQGESGLIACCRGADRPTYLRAARRLNWPNGAKSLLFSAEEPDRLRGEQSSGPGSGTSRHARPMSIRRAGPAALIRSPPSWRNRQPARWI